MSAEEIKSYAASHANDETAGDTVFQIPKLVLPTSQADKFAGLSGSRYTIGDAPTLPSTYSGALLPGKTGFGAIPGTGNVKISLFM
jgi:hypothetical protein